MSESTLRYHREFGVGHEMVSPSYAQYLVDRIAQLEAELTEMHKRIDDHRESSRAFSAQCIAQEARIGSLEKEVAQWKRKYTFEIDGADARIAALESFVQFVGNALDLHDDETDLGIEFRKLLVPTLENSGK